MLEFCTLGAEDEYFFPMDDFPWESGLLYPPSKLFKTSPYPITTQLMNLYLNIQKSPDSLKLAVRWTRSLIESIIQANIWCFPTKCLLSI